MWKIKIIERIGEKECDVCWSCDFDICCWSCGLDWGYAAMFIFLRGDNCGFGFKGIWDWEIGEVEFVLLQKKGEVGFSLVWIRYGILMVQK